MTWDFLLGVGVGCGLAALFDVALNWRAERRTRPAISDGGSSA